MRQGDRLEHTIPWGFAVPEAESGVRLRPPLDGADDLEARMPASERTAVMDGAPTRPTSPVSPTAPPPAHSGVRSSFMPPPSRMSSEPPPPLPRRPMSSAPPPAASAALVAPSAPPPMHPSILPAVQALMVATACGWIVPPAATRAGEERSAPPAPAPAALGWRLYVLFTTATMAALATSVVFLTGHASAMTHEATPGAPPVITVNVPPPPTSAAAPAGTASAAPVVAVAPAAPKAPARSSAPRVSPAPAKPANAPAASAAPAPSAPPPAAPSTASAQAQETADMLREQLGAAVH